MVASLLTGQPSSGDLAHLLRPEPLPNGTEPEERLIWFWRRNALEVFTLRPDRSSYECVAQSRLLPQLNVALLERCVRIESWREARRAFRAGLKPGK